MISSWTSVKILNIKQDNLNFLNKAPIFQTKSNQNLLINKITIKKCIQNKLQIVH